MKVLTQRSIKNTFLAVSLTKLFILMIDLVSQFLFLEVKMLLMNLLKQFEKKYRYCKKVIKKHFNKNLIMSEEEEQKFQLSNTCWICKEFIDNDDEKVRNHCQVTGKFRGATHWSCSKSSID